MTVGPARWSLLVIVASALSLANAREAAAQRRPGGTTMILKGHKVSVNPPPNDQDAAYYRSISVGSVRSEAPNGTIRETWKLKNGGTVKRTMWQSGPERKLFLKDTRVWHAGELHTKWRSGVRPQPLGEPEQPASQTP